MHILSTSVKFKKDRTKTCRGWGGGWGGCAHLVTVPPHFTNGQTHINSLISYTSGDN